MATGKLDVAAAAKPTVAATDGGGSFGHPCWSKMSTHSWLPALWARANAVWPWASRYRTSQPYCRREKRRKQSGLDYVIIPSSTLQGSFRMCREKVKPEQDCSKWCQKGAIKRAFVPFRHLDHLQLSAESSIKTTFVLCWVNDSEEVILPFLHSSTKWFAVMKKFIIIT